MSGWDFRDTYINNVNFNDLLHEVLFNMPILGEGKSKTTLIYELIDFIDYSARGWEDELFKRQNIFEITRRQMLNLLPDNFLEEYETVRRDEEREWKVK